MKNILFSWAKGGHIRLQILRKIHDCNKVSEPVFVRKIASERGISSVAVKKHIELLAKNQLVKVTNPKGKPKFLEVTDVGRGFAEDEDLFNELSSKKTSATGDKCALATNLN